MLEAGLKVCLGKGAPGISLALNVMSSVTFGILEQDLKHFPDSVARTRSLALSGLSLAFRPTVCQALGWDFTTVICSALCKVLSSYHRRSSGKPIRSQGTWGRYPSTVETKLYTQIWEVEGSSSERSFWIQLNRYNRCLIIVDFIRTGSFVTHASLEPTTKPRKTLNI